MAPSPPPAAARARRLPGGQSDRVQRHDQGLGVYVGPADRGAGVHGGAARRQVGVHVTGLDGMWVFTVPGLEPLDDRWVFMFLGSLGCLWNPEWQSDQLGQTSGCTGCWLANAHQCWHTTTTCPSSIIAPPAIGSCERSFRCRQVTYV